MVRKRPLSEEEQRLWKQVTRDVKKIIASPVPPASPMGEARIKVQPNRTASPPIIPRQGARLGELSVGAYADIDRNTAERFRKGEKAIDATLDLHGMTSAKAHHGLVAFLHNGYERGHRTLLVITGKGNGILRDALPAWLAAPELRPLILALDVAKQKHGGSGAYYILLRRRRAHDA